MAENWRPEKDWNNPHSHELKDYQDGVRIIVANPLHYEFEAGADAMYPFALEKGKAEGKVELLKWLHEPCYKHDAGLLRLGCPECWKDLRKELDYEH